VLQAYFDDSATNRQKPMVTAAGYVATVPQWACFTERWCTCLSRWHLGEWKTTDWLARSGCYEGWSEGDRWQAFEEFAKITEAHVLFGVSISVQPEQYRAEVEAVLKQPDHAMADPFRWCLQGVLEHLVSESLRVARDEPVAVILDKYARPEINVCLFNEVVAMLGAYAALPSFTHADSVYFQPIQAADMLASVSRRSAEDMVVKGQPNEGWELTRLREHVPIRVGHFTRAALAGIRQRVMKMDNQGVFTTPE